MEKGDAEVQEADREAFEEKVQSLAARLAGHFEESGKLKATIRTNLAGLGYAMGKEKTP